MASIFQIYPGKTYPLSDTKMQNKYKNSFPSVTIGIPVFNAEKFIVAAIESALAQDYKNLKILIYDNCSTDNSFWLCSELAAKFDNIQLKQQPYNVGSSLNFQTIIEECDTEFLCFLGADDYISSNWISEQFKNKDVFDFIGLGTMQLISSYEDRVYDSIPLNSVNYRSNFSFIRRLQFLFSPKNVPRMILLWGLFPSSKACKFDKLFAGKENGSFNDVLWSYEMLKNIKARTSGEGIYYKRVHSESESSRLLSEKRSLLQRLYTKVSTILFPPTCLNYLLGPINMNLYRQLFFSHSLYL